LKQFRKILNCIFALTLILMMIIVVGIEENSTYTKDVFHEDLSDGWMLSQPDGTRSEMTFPYDYPDDTPNIQIIRTLPQVPDYAILQIMCNYNSMTAYVEGEEIFHALPSTFCMVKTDMGHYVALIPLSSEYSGKEIEIHIAERESGYRSEIRYICLTSAAQYGLQILENNAFHLVVSLVMLLCAIASLVTWFALWERNGEIPEESYHPLLWITLFTASVGVWFFTEAYVWAISTGSFAASGTLNYLALSLMPLSLLGILKSICSEKLASLRWIVIIAKVMVITEWILFLTGLVDFSEMLLLMQVECVVAAGIFTVFLLWKRELFLVGDAIRYGTGALLAMLVITILSYFRGGNWLFWALGTALIILVSVILSIFMKLNRDFKDFAQTKQYKEYALTDIMSGLKSRYAYTIFEAQQKLGFPSNDLHLIFLDIDKLKKTNDTLGHVAGDEMIIAVSKCIKDAFGDAAECFRMGGDEFLVAMTAETELVQERLAMFDRLVSQWHGRYVDSITVSYGVAAANEHPGLNFEELLRSADYMMYQRKNRKPGENNL
jgi:diguanylate cyclase (GGDEF)-like protein